ncbi:MFS transporter [Gluconacetobacter entanii]|nr:MFS transporter [Gluconacetobacter entanii]
MDVSTMGVALPAIQAELGMAPTALQWAVSAYVIGYGGFLLLGGRVGDILGHRRVFIWSLGVFAVGSLAGGMVNDETTLILTRLIKGIAAAFSTPAALALLLSIFHEKEARGKALGVFAAASATGFVLGMVLGGAATIFSWRVTLVMGAPAILIVLAFAPVVLPADPRKIEKHAKFDWAGALTVTPGLLLLVFGITSAANKGWYSTVSLGSLFVAVGLIVWFIFLESTHIDPMVPLKIFRKKTLCHANAVSALNQGCYIGFQFVAVIYYQHGLGWSSLLTGLSFTFGGLVMMVLSRRFAALAQSRGPTSIMTIGMSFQAASYIFWAVARDHAHPIFLVALSQVLQGLGYTMVFPAVQIAALSDVEDRDAGLASSLLFAAFQIGSGIVLAITSAVFSVASARGWNPYSVSMGFLCCLAIISTLVAAMGPRKASAASAVTLSDPTAT